MRSAVSNKVYYSSPSSVKERQLGLVRASTDGLDWSSKAAFATTLGATGYGYSSLTNLPAASGGKQFLGVLWEKQVVGDPSRPPTDLAFSHVPLSLEVL